MAKFTCIQATRLEMSPGRREISSHDARCAAILVYCSVRDWTRFCYVIVHTLLWRADSRISGFAAKLAGYVWTEAVFGEKKLRIQKYPDTCGQGL